MNIRQKAIAYATETLQLAENDPTHKAIGEAYLEGAKQERCNGWHNIRQNPRDLPKKNGVYLIVELQYGRPSYDTALYWPYRQEFTGRNCSVLDVIAWHKLPPYKK